MACPRSALPECAARSVLCPLVCDGTLQAEILASFLLSDGAQIVAALLSGTIPVPLPRTYRTTLFVLRVALCGHRGTRYNAGRMVSGPQGYTSSQPESA